MTRTDDANGLVQETVYLDDMPVVVLKRNAAGQMLVHYICADHLNAPKMIIRAIDNKMVWRWVENDPFGAIQPMEDPPGMGAFIYNLRFPGQVYDKESGLYYNYYRDYDPQTGRYVQSDPIGLLGGLNSYSYVNSDPLKLADPRGLVPNPAELACFAGPNPVCVGGVVVDIGSWVVTELGTGAAIAAVSASGDSASQLGTRQGDYDAYKGRCNEPPPPGLDPCAEARWKLERNKACRTMRQNWDSKYQPGRHAGYCKFGPGNRKTNKMDC